MKHSPFIITIVRLFLLLLPLTVFGKKPDLFLLKTYTDQNVSTWFMSEKLDGVRAFWDGEKLISRSGKVFAAPTFFTKDFPKHKLDGELWIKRSAFSEVVSIVNQKRPHQGWNKITYNIFEVPDAKGNLLQRLQNVKESKYLKIIKQMKIETKIELKSYLKKIEKLGGEGIAVRDGSLAYYTGRNGNALKVKNYQDAECEVVSYNQGQGKYENMMGSLSCKMENKQIIKIGSGFSKQERINPPKIGAIITFKYYGLTSKGNPRFPIFLRVKGF